MHQNEEDENRDNARGCERMDERRYQRRQGLQSAGIRLLDLRRIRVASFLPALLVAPVLVAIFAR